VDGKDAALVLSGACSGNRQARATIWKGFLKKSCEGPGNEPYQSEPIAGSLAFLAKKCRNHDDDCDGGI
jgi:hypothetical protein